MPKPQINTDILQSTTLLPSNFNKKAFTITYSDTDNPYAREIQNAASNACLGKKPWNNPAKINGWMISAETETFMKAGGLGMIASELPQAFNRHYAEKGEHIAVVMPMYQGNTGKKKAVFDGKIYEGAEHQKIPVQKLKEITVPFMDIQEKFIEYKVGVYTGIVADTTHIFLENNHFFGINPHPNNPLTQDGCYIMNDHGVEEVERFAFFSKAVYELFRALLAENTAPNIIITNDWHSGALSGLMKCLPLALLEKGLMRKAEADKMRSVPIIHIAHHLGYQGWDYENTARILNSLYEAQTAFVFKNAKAITTPNPRTKNTLIVHDCYNQASCNFHLADRIITVSKNYLDEVSNELGFGHDFRDILKIRKEHHTFFGIMNGYDKSLISPNEKKIKDINNFFGDTDFRVYDENSLENKQHNKSEFIKLISRIATDKVYKEKVIPLIETYKFEAINSITDAKKIPIICTTSRLVEQKGYDIAVQSILNWIKQHLNKGKEMPVFILGGAGNIKLFKMLKELKDRVAKIDKEAVKRIFVFRGYKDQFAYAIQLSADFYLMPSSFEPCGLTQMEAMAKGTLPIAMSTGGLVDTIEDKIDGFRTEVFFNDNHLVYGDNTTAQRLKNNENAYIETLDKALRSFYDTPDFMTVMQRKAMQKNFDWDMADGPLEKYYTLLHTGHL